MDSKFTKICFNLIQVLSGIPPGHPPRLNQIPILQSEYFGIENTYKDHSPESKRWFETLFETGSIPDFEEASTAVDYFDFSKLRYSETSSTSATEQVQVQMPISIVTGVGQAAISGGQRVFAVGDLVAVRPPKKSKDSYWLAKIKRILGKNDEEVMEFKCVWMKSTPDGRSLKWSVTSSNTKNSTAVLNENMVLVHGFLLTNRGRLRKETEMLLKNTLEADATE